MKAHHSNDNSLEAGPRSQRRRPKTEVFVFHFQHKHSNMADEFPLHDAALRGDFEKVKQLLENSYPVDTKDKEGSTALI
jgi:ankyrin repeat protein